MKTKTKKKNKAAPTVTESSGNVFADLGLRNPEQELLKARLTLQIYRVIREPDRRENLTGVLTECRCRNPDR